MGDCPICAHEDIEPGDVGNRLLDEHWPDDSHPDYVGLRRALEREYDIEIAVSAVKEHDLEHIRYVSPGVELSQREPES